MYGDPGDPPDGAIGHTPTKSGFRYNFWGKKCPHDLKMVQKDTPAILHNLREKSGDKNKY
jgi:hypothetical protein